jgi:hypothetical protein
MTNREKYAERILDIACSETRIAVEKKCYGTGPVQRYFMQRLLF